MTGFCGQKNYFKKLAFFCVLTGGKKATFELRAFGGSRIRILCKVPGGYYLGGCLGGMIQGV